MTAPKVLLVLGMVLHVAASGGEARTNESGGSVIESRSTRLWICSLVPCEVATEHREYPVVDPSAASTPEIPRFLAMYWGTNYDVFSEHLVAAAAKARLDSASLAKILLSIRNAKQNEGLAILPVEAHATYVKGELVWAITLRWEGMGLTPYGAGHRRLFVFTQKTLKLIEFETCG